MFVSEFSKSSVMFERFKRAVWSIKERLNDADDPTSAEQSIDSPVDGNPAYTTTPHKKKLVITDWKTRNVDYFFKQLIDEKFELYVCQGTDIKLTSKNELQADLAKVNPTPKKDVIQIMAKKSIPADHVLILDYFLINQLEYTDIQKPLYIINFDDLKDKDIDFFNSLLGSIEGEGVHIGIEGLFGKNDIFEKYLNPLLEKFNHISYLFSDINYLQQLFALLPPLAQTLERLKIYFSQNYPQDINFIKKFTNLKVLSLTGASITKSLLAYYHNLEKMTLFSCVINDDDSNDDFTLEKIRELDLIASSITMKSLHELLKHCPNLVKIDLCRCEITCEIINDISKDSTFENSTINVLDLSKSSITMKSLNELLKHCPNLVKINLSDCKNIYVASELQLSDLKKLQELDLSGSSITMKSLNELLKHCPNLVKINLRGCQYPYIQGASEELQLSDLKLQELDLGWSSITMKSLNELLKHCPNLVKINLRDCQYQYIQGASEEFQLSDLQKLDLSGSSITMKSLNELLKHCPNLVKIKLRGCKHIDVDSELQFNNLEKLKDLDLNMSRITTESLIRLLKHCPNLDILNLYGCNVSIGNPLENELKKIKEVTLPQPKISSLPSQSSTSKPLTPPHTILTTPASAGSPSIFRKRWFLGLVSFAAAAIGILFILTGVGTLPGITLVATVIGLSAPLLSQLASTIGSILLCSLVVVAVKHWESLVDRIKNLFNKIKHIKRYPEAEKSADSHSFEYLKAVLSLAVYDEIPYLSLDEKTRNKLQKDCHVSPPTTATKNYTFEQFIVTESRKNTLRLLDDHFSIRELKINNKIIAGISGFLLEGPSGIGKSEMAIEYLRAQKYQNGFEATSEVDSTHRYYHITPTNHVLMKEILVKAFHEGAVVIIDEFNTLPLEKTLNSLMSEGTDPQGQKPKKEGFFVIATQNPISFTGRQVLSDPLDKRVHKIELPTYPDHELIEILLMKGLAKTKATDLVNEYNDQRTNASYNNLDLPTPRDLFNRAEAIITKANQEISQDPTIKEEDRGESSVHHELTSPPQGSTQLVNNMDSQPPVASQPVINTGLPQILPPKQTPAIFGKKWIWGLVSFAVAAIGILFILTGVGTLPGITLVAAVIGLSVPLLSQLAIAIGSTIICSPAVAVAIKLGKSLFNSIKNAIGYPAAKIPTDDSSSSLGKVKTTMNPSPSTTQPNDENTEENPADIVYTSPIGPITKKGKEKVLTNEHPAVSCSSQNKSVSKQ